MLRFPSGLKENTCKQFPAGCNERHLSSSGVPVAKQINDFNMATPSLPDPYDFTEENFLSPSGHRSAALLLQNLEYIHTSATPLDTNNHAKFKVTTVVNTSLIQVTYEVAARSKLELHNASNLI